VQTFRSFYRARVARKIVARSRVARTERLNSLNAGRICQLDTPAMLHRILHRTLSLTSQWFAPTYRLRVFVVIEYVHEVSAV